MKIYGLIIITFVTPMRKAIVISFLSIYVLSITELHQLLKFPILFEHFSEHHQKDNEISFWKFLYAHYAFETFKDGDFDKDSKLPFKTSDTCNCSNHINNLSEIKICFETETIFFKKETINKYYPKFTNSVFLKSIWQPPKFNYFFSF